MNLIRHALCSIVEGNSVLGMQNAYGSSDMTKLVLSALAAVGIMAIGAPHAQAIPLHYDVGTGYTVDANSGSGLEMEWALASDLSSRAFTLDDGQSVTFKFFDIWTDETSVNADDTAPKSIKATLNFTVPDFYAVVGGNTVGVNFFGIIQAGLVIWDNPAPTFTALDRTFSVDLSDEAFNLGLFGLSEGECYGATVEATVKQISSFSPNTSAVPDSGATVLLLGLSLLAFEAYRRSVRPKLVKVKYN